MLGIEPVLPTLVQELVFFLISFHLGIRLLLQSICSWSTPSNVQGLSWWSLGTISGAGDQTGARQRPVSGCGFSATEILQSIWCTLGGWLPFSFIFCIVQRSDMGRVGTFGNFAVQEGIEFGDLTECSL